MSINVKKTGKIMHFNFKKARKIASNIYSMSYILEEFIKKNGSICELSHVNYIMHCIKENSDVLYAMLINYNSKEKEDFSFDIKKSL